jgi:hypothetical protein
MESVNALDSPVGKIEADVMKLKAGMAVTKWMTGFVLSRSSPSCSSTDGRGAREAPKSEYQLQTRPMAKSMAS